MTSFSRTMKHLLPCLLFASTGLMAAETYTLEMQQAIKIGHGHVDLQLLLTLERGEGDRLAGELAVSGGRGGNPCPNSRKLTGSTSADGSVRFKTDEVALPGCGFIMFSGRQDGNSLVGSLRFQGTEQNVVFKGK